MLSKILNARRRKQSEDLFAGWGAIRSDQYRAPKTGDILKYHSYDDLK